MKDFFTKKRAALMACVFAVVTALTTVCAFAEGGGSANSAVVTGFTGMASDMVATGQALIPVALTVVAISLVVRFGIKLFKSIYNK